MPFRLLLILVAWLIVGNQASSDDLPEFAQEFKLPGLSDDSIELKKSDQPTIVFFLGTECPLVKLYCNVIGEIVANQKKQIRVIGISSNRQDSLDDLTSFVKSHEIKFEVAKDFQNRIADQLGATRTPEVLLLNSDLKIVYRGRVDDQYSPGITRAVASEHFLKNAVEQLVAGKKIDVSKTEPVGCLIGKVREPIKNSSVTYCKQISRFLQKNCVECHRDGGIGPFALTDYEEVVGWSEMMVEVVGQRRMPPWHASSEHGEFLNARIVDSEDKKLLYEWVENGSPYGEQKDLPAPRKFTQGWEMQRKPDVVLNMGTQPFEVPPTGVVEYQYFVVDPKFKEDKWVKAAQVLPQNSSVVHHSIVFVRPPDGSRFRGIGWLSAYVPGQKPISLPDGHARLIPAGSKLVFQQHYTPNGKTQKDLTKVGLVFADESEVKHEVYTVVGINQDFVIPAETSDYPVTATVNTLPKKGKLLSLSPHMHLRGRSFRAISKNTNVKEKPFSVNASKVICDVPAYDFNWQHIYVFRRPIDLEKLGTLHFEARFDNSSKNPVNPNPRQVVTWGDQTFEEMAVAFFDVSVPRFQSKSKPPVSTEKKTMEKKPNHPRVTKFVDSFFKKNDANQNGRVERNETPRALRDFGFWKYDTNRDNILTREEVINAARSYLKVPKQN